MVRHPLAHCPASIHAAGTSRKKMYGENYDVGVAGDWRRFAAYERIFELLLVLLLLLLLLGAKTKVTVKHFGGKVNDKALRHWFLAYLTQVSKELPVGI